MSSEKKQKPSKAEIAIFQIAESVFKNEGYGDESRKIAKEKSAEFTISDLESFKKLFHNPPKESELYNYKKHGLGAWLSTCQFAIFEIYFNLGEEAIPFIREIAWGEYDWTQGNAIELLIRFAASGIQREEILNDIKRNYPDIRYEAQLYAIQPLIPKLGSDPELKAIFDELIELESFRESYQELTEV